MKFLTSIIIAMAQARPAFIIDGDGNVLDWHGPHGGHHKYFSDVAYFHGPHGGPSDPLGIEVHGHGPHGGHPASAKLTYKEALEQMKAIQAKRAAAEAEAESHAEAEAEEHHEDAVADHGHHGGHYGGY